MSTQFGLEFWWANRLRESAHFRHGCLKESDLHHYNAFYTVSQKRQTPCSSSYLQQIFTDFKTFFTVTIPRKFAIKLLLKIPSYLKRVATLPCEILTSEN